MHSVIELKETTSMITDYHNAILFSIFVENLLKVSFSLQLLIIYFVDPVFH